MNTEAVRVGATIKAMRGMRGLTQEQLANAAMLSRPFVANVEAGRKPISGKALARFADALGVEQVAIAIPAEVVAEEVAA